MTPSVIVIGGGYLGQLIKYYLPYARVFDWRSGPQLTAMRSLGPQYLWRPLPGLEHRHFTVTTHVDGAPATPAAVRAYKAKVGKEQDASDWVTQFRIRMDGYEAIMPEVQVEYGRRLKAIWPKDQMVVLSDGDRTVRYDYLLSTIPLFALQSLMVNPAMSVPLKFAPIYVRTEQATNEPFGIRPPHMYVNYLSGEGSAYRETYREGSRYLESLQPNGGHKIMPGKIYPADVSRLHLQLASYGIYCFGRFATWHPEELAHDSIDSLIAFVAAVGLPSSHLGGSGSIQYALPVSAEDE